MPEFPTTVTILPAPGAVGGVTLALTQPSYELVSVTMAERTWRRHVVNSMDVEGDVELQSVLDSGVYEIELRCKGISTADVNTARTNLLVAIEQRAFLLQVTVDGVSQTWQARRADSITSQEKFFMFEYMRPMTLRIPVQPRTTQELA